MNMQGYFLAHDLHVPASHGTAGHAQKGDLLEIIDLGGKQVGDLMAWPTDASGEWMSPAHTITRNWNICPKVGDAICTNKRRDLFRIGQDDVGYHDILVPCCDREAYVTRYGLHNHRSCLENIREALAAIGETSRHLSGELAWNIFMKNTIGPAGEMRYEAPVHPPGASLRLHVLLPCVFALSACPQDQTATNGFNCSDLSIRIWSPRQ